MEKLAPRTRVLIVSTRPALAAGLVKEMKRHPHVEMVGDVVRPTDALDSRVVPTTLSPDVILIDGEGAGADLFALMGQLMLRWPNSLIVVVTLLMEAEEIQQVLLNGARAVLPLTWGSEKIVESLRKLHVQEWRRLQEASSKEEGEGGEGYVVVVAGMKGGIGRTFLAVNLAAALKKLSGKSVMLMDADWGDVDVSLYMNLLSRYDVTELLNHYKEMDRDLLEGVLSPHSSGVEVLTAPKNPIGLPTVPPVFFPRLFSLIRSRFAYIVIDTRAHMDEVTASAMDNSNAVLRSPPRTYPRCSRRRCSWKRCTHGNIPRGKRRFSSTERGTPEGYRSRRSNLSSGSNR
jgi:pilus assembly protein CpaE